MVALGSKFAVVVLMLSVVTTGLSAQSFVGASPRLAGCHSHGHHPASLLSVDHNCCQSGHDSALVKPAIDLIPDPAPESALEPALPLLDTNIYPSEAIRLSGDPPVSPPLLI